MGLDFSLYKKKKDMSIDDLFNLIDTMPYEEFEKEYELAYGRRAYELVRFLSSKQEEIDGYGFLKRDRWDSLIKLMKPIGNKLYKISEAFEHEYYADEVSYPELVFTDEDKKLINEYEIWYDKTFGGEPYLGYEFSLGYMTDFWNAQDIVRNYLDDPDYDVIMIISY